MNRLQTELDDRTLRFDGVSVVNAEDVDEALIRGVLPQQLRVRGWSEDLDNFNRQVAEADRLYQEESEAPPINIKMGWQLPEEYRNLNLEDRIADDFANRLPKLKYTDDQTTMAINRIDAELKEIRKRGMVEFTKTVIFVLDTFRKNNVVWGVGRGSSCASYILFIIGLHVVDCVKFNVPMEEFFHD
jgi:DNA polymerase III alpha subunit